MQKGVTMRYWLTAIALALSLSEPSPVLSQEAPPTREDPAHNELRAVKRGAEEAFNKGDIDGLLSDYANKGVIVTWQNAEVNTGHDAIKKFYNRMMVGPGRVVDSLQTKIEVDDLSHLYGSTTATALGDMDQHYKLMDGLEFDLHSRWTATLVKDDNRWKIAAFHVSTNMFDNGVLHTAVRKTTYWAGGIAGVVALVVGILAGRFTKRSRPAGG
jgi:ketosteroid isomerase-like protein